MKDSVPHIRMLNFKKMTYTEIYKTFSFLGWYIRSYFTYTANYIIFLHFIKQNLLKMAFYEAFLQAFD